VATLSKCGFVFDTDSLELLKQIPISDKDNHDRGCLNKSEAKDTSLTPFQTIDIEFDTPFDTPLSNSFSPHRSHAFRNIHHHASTENELPTSPICSEVEMLEEIRRLCKKHTPPHSLKLVGLDREYMEAWAMKIIGVIYYQERTASR